MLKYMRSYRASWGYDGVGYTLEDNQHRYRMSRKTDLLFKSMHSTSGNWVDEMKVMRITDFAVKNGLQRFKRIK